MGGYFWLGEWIVGDAETNKSLNDENGNEMVFASRDVALAVLALLQSSGYFKKGMAVPYNHSAEVSKN